MHIAAFRVNNYKSFLDSGEIGLEPGINVIVGQNNVGKTALTEALSLNLGAQPHRSRKTIPTRTILPDSNSSAMVSCHFDPEEFKEVAARNLPSTVYIPGSQHGVDSTPLVGPFLNVINRGPTIRVVRTSQANNDNGGYSSTIRTTQVVGYDQPPNVGHYLRFDINRESGEFEYVPGNYGVGAQEAGAFFHALTTICQKRLYAFKAVRFGINEYPIGLERELAPDASNLVQVLHLLQTSNPWRWERYVKSVRVILPQIKAMTFVPTSAGSVRLLLWNVESNTERDDLAVSLSESGTGVGQVLAILYVAFASESPRAIVIDEPQSFLHPGAVRKLLEILKGYPQHQYIITTHSPTAVMAADPRTLLLVRKEEEESVVEPVDATETQHQGLLLKEVGARLADVFGADNILWVEGPTEEECFPLILSAMTDHQLMGTKILGVVHTGDFEGKRTRTVFRIYERLSEGRGLLPPAVGFIFDQEGRKEQERLDLERESRGRVVFTPRRMYENYLLNPHAIVAVTSQIEGMSADSEVTLEEVEGWLECNRWESKYFGNRKVSESARTNEVWLEKVHAAKLLEDLFEYLSGTRVTYRKVIHGTALTRWLLRNEPETLRELAQLIVGRLTDNAKT